MSGAVARRANSMSKRFGGRTTFFYALVREFVAWKNTEVTVTLDGGERRGAMHDVIVANGRWHGGGMKLAPDASPDDGLFDVVLIGDVNKLDFVTTAPKLYSGKHVAHPKVEVLRSATRDASTRRSRCRSSSRARPSARRRRASRSCRAPYACAYPPDPRNRIRLRTRRGPSDRFASCPGVPAAGRSDGRRST